MSKTMLFSTPFDQYLVNKELIKYIQTDNALDNVNLNAPTIAFKLCGINSDIALDFMQGDLSKARIFFDNVRFNGPNSNPLIVKAIYLALNAYNKIVSN